MQAGSTTRITASLVGREPCLAAEPRAPRSRAAAAPSLVHLPVGRGGAGPAGRTPCPRARVFRNLNSSHPRRRPQTSRSPVGAGVQAGGHGPSRRWLLSRHLHVLPLPLPLRHPPFTRACVRVHYVLDSSSPEASGSCSPGYGPQGFSGLPLPLDAARSRYVQSAPRVTERPFCA